MLYPRCPGCRTILANKQIPYEDGLDKICKNDKLTESQKQKQKEELLDQLYVQNICCRMRIMGYVSKIKIVKN